MLLGGLGFSSMVISKSPANAPLVVRKVSLFLPSIMLFLGNGFWFLCMLNVFIFEFWVYRELVLTLMGVIFCHLNCFEIRVRSHGDWRAMRCKLFIVFYVIQFKCMLVCLSECVLLNIHTTTNAVILVHSSVTFYGWVEIDSCLVCGIKCFSVGGYLRKKPTLHYGSNCNVL